MLSYSETDFLVAELNRQRRHYPSAVWMPQMYVVNSTTPLFTDFDISSVLQYFLFSSQGGVDHFNIGKATFPVDLRGDYYLCSIGYASWDITATMAGPPRLAELRVQITDGRTGFAIWDDSQDLPPAQSTIGVNIEPERLPVPYRFLAGGEIVVDVSMGRADSPGSVDDLLNLWSIGLMGVQLVRTP